MYCFYQVLSKIAFSTFRTIVSDLSFDCVEILLKFMYTGKMTLQDQNHSEVCFYLQNSYCHANMTTVLLVWKVYPNYSAFYDTLYIA